MQNAGTTGEDAGSVRGTTVGRIFHHLKEGILGGRYAPGQRLIEADLTQEFKVSRGPLREAFRRLSAEGLVESVPNRGAIVRRLSHKETQELFQIRGALESMAARLAAERIRNAEIRQRFEDAIALIWSDESRNHGTIYLEENRIFHQAVADTSGNAQLAALCRQLQLPLIMFQLGSNMKPEMLRLSNQEHRAIASAILDGDGERAAILMQHHLDRARLFSDDMPQTIYRPPSESSE